MQELQNEAKDKIWCTIIKKPEIIPEMPSKTAVAKFWLIIEHDYLAKHLNKIGIFANPNFPLCNNEEEMTEEYLETCKALPAGSFIEKYWSARALMSSLPNAKH